MRKIGGIVFLDLVILMMSVIWTFYIFLKGIEWIELIYVYVYFTLVFLSSVLNLTLLLEKKKRID